MITCQKNKKLDSLIKFDFPIFVYSSLFIIFYQSKNRNNLEVCVLNKMEQRDKMLSMKNRSHIKVLLDLS